MDQDLAYSVQEGFVAVHGHQVWYRSVGEDADGKAPLLCLHGGPGATHDYLEPLEALAATGRRVILYDQLGSGNSDHPNDPSLWTIERFVEEVGIVRRALGLERVHILGQSWGGILALEYSLQHPSGLLSLTAADTPASVPQWLGEIARLRARLPHDVQQTLMRHEQAGTTDDPTYQEAALVFYNRHVCRLDPWPECLSRTFAKLCANPEVYSVMNGPSEFYVTGVIKDWDIRERLGEIRTPTLVLGGRYDEVTPTMTHALHRGIRGSKWTIFERSSHMPHLEETELYLRVLERFLARAERMERASEPLAALAR